MAKALRLAPQMVIHERADQLHKDERRWSISVKKIRKIEV
jgi:hypothetical protein